MNLSAFSTLKQKLSPYLRGGFYYASRYGAIAIYFSYANIVFIDRGITGVQLGTINALSSLVVLFASPILAGIADRKGQHIRMLSILLFLYGVMIGLFTFTHSFTLLLPVALLAAFVGAPMNAIGDSAVVSMASKYQIDFGRMRLWGSFGYVLFGFFAGWLWDQISLEMLFLIGGAAFIFESVITLLLDGPDTEQQTHDPEVETAEEAVTSKSKFNLEQWLVAFQDRQFLIYLIGMFFLGCGMMGYFSYNGIFMKSLSPNLFIVSLAFTIPGVTEIPSLFLAGKINRGGGSLRNLLMIVIGGGVFTIFVGVTGFIQSPGGMLIVSALRGMVFGFYLYALVGFAASRAPKHLASTYQSLSGVFHYTLSSLIFLPLLGILYDRINIQTVFWASALIGVLGLLMLTGLYLSMRAAEKTRQASAGDSLYESV
ncbi:MAG: MFS transporter [Anaerolineaceae bacterium]|nr:MFS transporter [Anaerolineaceae bacterium]